MYRFFKREGLFTHVFCNLIGWLTLQRKLEKLRV